MPIKICTLSNSVQNETARKGSIIDKGWFINAITFSRAVANSLGHHLICSTPFKANHYHIELYIRLSILFVSIPNPLTVIILRDIYTHYITIDTCYRNEFIKHTRMKFSYYNPIAVSTLNHRMIHGNILLVFSISGNVTLRRLFWCLVSSVRVTCLILPVLSIKEQSSSLCPRNELPWQHGLQLTNNLPCYANIGLDAVVQTYHARWWKNNDPPIAATIMIEVNGINRPR